MDTKFFTPGLLEQFLENGYVKMPAAVPTNLLKKLRIYFEEIEEEATESEFFYWENKGKKYLTNIDQLCHKKNLACLELLGAPFLLDVAETICGKDFFPVQEFAVIKNYGDDLPVLWHQDMLHERKGRCCTVGIYLDDANPGDGALKIVPKSHTGEKDICSSSKEPFLEIPMQAGDILIHDMMLAHSSDPLSKNDKRRVIYVEFLSEKHVMAEQIYEQDKVAVRKQIVPLAIAYYQHQNPGSRHFMFTKELSDQFPATVNWQELLAPIYLNPIRARPSTYCF